MYENYCHRCGRWLMINEVDKLCDDCFETSPREKDTGGLD